MATLQVKSNLRILCLFTPAMISWHVIVMVDSFLTDLADPECSATCYSFCGFMDTDTMTSLFKNEAQDDAEL
jgi:hypothetical protein